MTIKEYLSKYRMLNEEINALCEELTQLRTLMHQTGGSYWEKQGKKSSQKGGAGFEPVVDKFVITEELINKKIEAAVDIRNEIAAVIEEVEDITLKTLLRYRYICCYNFEQVAEAMNFSYIHVVKNLHPKALQVVKYKK